MVLFFHQATDKEILESSPVTPTPNFTPYYLNRFYLLFHIV